MNERVEYSDHQRLMASGVLAAKAPRTTCTVIERGMLMLSRGGDEIGKVAAVSVDVDGAVKAVLLSRLPSVVEYRIVPDDLVASVHEGTVALTIDSETVEALEKHCLS